LCSKSTHVVSPQFDLDIGSDRKKAFSMRVQAKVVTKSKGGASFRNALGRGFVQLKCEAEMGEEEVANVRFRIFIGSGLGFQEFRGPVLHDFSAWAVAGLQKDQEEFDFNRAVEQDTQTFVVGLEIMPTAG